MILKAFVLVLWVLLMLLVAFGGRVKLFGETLNPIIGAIVGPVIAVVMGLMFLVIGALFSVPVWIWFVL